MTTASTYSSDDEVLSGWPIPQAQPERLAAIARVWGMQPAGVEQAGVLEIGCGGGGNLLPMAERYPQSRFLGIDASAQRVAAAEAEARALGLKNIEFRRADVLEFDADGAPFDYILAPDVYSLASAESRDKLLAICHGRLAPQGIAYLNYHVYPGWQAHELLGSMMRFDARAGETVARKVAAARALLEFLHATFADDLEGYPAMIAGAGQLILERPDSSLYRDYLQHAGFAVYYGQFVEHARGHGLQVLGECTSGIRLSDFLATKVEQKLAALARDDVEKDQYRDILENRAHRQSLLCHARVPLDRALTPARLRGLYLESRLRPEQPDVPLDSSTQVRFVAPDGLGISTAVPSVKAALSHLGEIWPNYATFEDLVAAAGERVERLGLQPPPAGSQERLEDNLLQSCLGGIIQVHSAPQPFTSHIGERPAGSPLARRQAARVDVVTNRMHVPVQLDVFDRHLLVLLDGTSSVEQLVDHVAEAAAAGKLGLFDNGEPVPTHRAKEFIQGELATSLKRLADHALLIA
jgi:methyltransferase-like protein/SAM-dependent methyltransferase